MLFRATQRWRPVTVRLFLKYAALSSVIRLSEAMYVQLATYVVRVGGSRDLVTSTFCFDLPPVAAGSITLPSITLAAM